MPRRGRCWSCGSVPPALPGREAQNNTPYSGILATVELRRSLANTEERDGVDTRHADTFATGEHWHDLDPIIHNDSLYLEE